MSKVSFSRELLGTIRFIFDKTKSRTLNATQAYDKSTSQIVLASYPATSTINTPTKSLGRDDLESQIVKTDGNVNATGTQYPVAELFVPRGKADLPGAEPVQTINLDWYQPPPINLGWCPVSPVGAAKQRTEEVVGSVVPLTGVDTVQFAGIIVDTGAIRPADRGTKSNATKEIFAGNITVGTGLYRTWQGKYAVLKVDLLTDKAILRVYNE